MQGDTSGLLGDLTGLTELRLEGNKLMGAIPSKLLRLGSLTHLYLAGNRLEGCVPHGLLEVPNHDLGSLGLPGCPPPPNVSTTWDRGMTLEGGTTYRFGSVVFDVPAAARLEPIGLVLSSFTTANEFSGLSIEFNEIMMKPLIGIDGAAVSHRRTHDGILDRIAESLWEAPDALLALWEAEAAEAE